MKISSNPLFELLPRWSPADFPLKTAFLLGASVGFLFRPLDHDTMQARLPPLLSLWGVWQFPVVLLFGLMWYKIIYVLVQQKEHPSIWRIMGSHIILFCTLALLVGGIAPVGLLPQIHAQLYLYTLLNPFVVGLVVTFIFEDSNRSSFAPGRAALAGVVAWIGTSTLYFIVVLVHRLVAPIAQNSCGMICIPSDPTIIIMRTAPIWIGIGLLLAFLGTIIGGQLCQLSLGQKKRESDMDQ